MLSQFLDSTYEFTQSCKEDDNKIEEYIEKISHVECKEMLKNKTL